MNELKLTESWLRNHGYELRENGWWKTNGVAPGGPLPRAKLEHSAQHEREGTNPPQTRSAPARRRVCVTMFRCRSIDPDNACVKWVIDGLRYSGVITNDTRADIELVVKEVLVKHRCEERTRVDVTVC